MLYKMIAVVLVAVLLHGSLIAQTQPQSPVQTPAEMQQILHQAQGKDKAVKITVRKKIDNQKKFSGKVSDISDTAFVVTDQKTGRIHKLTYEDVREVHQKGLSKGAKILIVSLVVVGALIGIAFAVACSAEGGPHC
ncbi:MAG: hypothetical protein LAO56_14785 [Acidobacteriia bacterium]|nr:hypothetical protein [Terriglobia bacterium]